MTPEQELEIADKRRQEWLDKHRPKRRTPYQETPRDAFGEWVWRIQQGERSTRL